MPPGLSAGMLLFSSGAAPLPPQDKQGKSYRTYHSAVLNTIHALHLDLAFPFSLVQINFLCKWRSRLNHSYVFETVIILSCSVLITKNTIATNMTRLSTHRVQRRTPRQPKSKTDSYCAHLLLLMNHVHRKTFFSDHQWTTLELLAVTLEKIMVYLTAKI